MEFLQQIRWLINNRDSNINQIQANVINKSYIPSFIAKYWCHKTTNQKKLFVGEILFGLGLVYYILSPSLSKNPKMFSKRPDKHTTGLINLHNDCFANSSIQAYSSLLGLTEYLNEFIQNFHELTSFLQEKNISIKDLETSRLNQIENLDKKLSKKSNFNLKSFDIPLHIAFATILKTLQETQLSSRTVSAWTFLHKIEEIFNAKISRSQHDAHEFTQLINETLENENLKMKSFHKYLKTNLHDILGASNPPLPQDYRKLSTINFPEYPFCGLLLNQMQCLQCQKLSKPSLSPFLMLTLPTPQLLETELDTIIHENKSESIEGYQCLKCRISKIIENENHWNRQLDEESEKYLPILKKLNDDVNFFINEDLDEDLEKFIKNYNVKGLDISKVTSTVFNKIIVLKPPKIFGIHLSRSTFDGVNFTRNPCRVSFQESLKITIGPEYHEELKKFADIQDEFDPDIHTENVLTNDVNDMNDESAQLEDIDERGSADEESSVETQNGDEEIEDDEDDDDFSEITPPSVSTNLELLNTLNNTPISIDQTNSLRAQFEQFKFNETDVYKYRLKAIIRHQGSHTQGHYECFKRKPLYVKDKDGNILKLSPEILEESTQTAPPKKSTPPPPIVKTSNDVDESGLKKKLSEMIGRNPAVFQTDPQSVNFQEFHASGVQSPTEITLDQHNLNYFLKGSTPNQKSNFASKQEPVKMKKIPSIIKHPFWRISDSQVTEVSRNSVLWETSTVYMLYYERIDKN
jgi:ubiquitin carboxyl-terminal hydrolase 16